MTIDKRAFRDALGCFATGVTVVTTTTAEGGHLGLTANSFSSVSLDPPLVLFCLDNQASSFEAMTSGSGFCVNVLAADQRGLSERFADKDADRFPEIPSHLSEAGHPIIEGALAVIDCAGHAVHDGGDHAIIVGRVLSFEVMREATPLLYWRGRYRGLS